MGSGHSNFLFSTGQRVWTAADLTRHLRQYSQVSIQQPIHSRLYRQLAIAVLEKKLPQLLQPFDVNDDTDPHHIDHAVRSWQSGHRPRQRAAYYGHDGILPNSLTPALLEAYVRSSTRWHQFLGLRYSSPLPSTTNNETASPKRKRPLGDQPNPVAHQPRSGFSPSKRSKQLITTIDSDKRRDISDQVTQQVIGEIDKHPPNDITSSNLDVSTVSSNPQHFLQGSSSPILCFYPQHTALVCVPCGLKIGPGKSFETHFRNTHRLKGQNLKDAITFSHRVGAINDVAPLPNGSPIIPHLHLRNGFECHGCGYLSPNLKTQQSHCANCAIARDLKPKWRRVDIQSWSTGRYVDYWTVGK